MLSHISEDRELMKRSVLNEAQDLTEEPVLPRKRRVPRKTSEEAECYHHETPKDHYIQKYFEVLNVV